VAIRNFPALFNTFPDWSLRLLDLIVDGNVLSCVKRRASAAAIHAEPAVQIMASARRDGGGVIMKERRLATSELLVRGRFAQARESRECR
jgi:hypothetical protein